MSPTRGGAPGLWRSMFPQSYQNLPVLMVMMMMIVVVMMRIVAQNVALPALFTAIDCAFLY